MSIITAFEDILTLSITLIILLLNMVKQTSLIKANALYTARCAHFLRFGNEFEEGKAKPLLSWPTVSELLGVPVERLKWWHRRFSRPEKEVQIQSP